MLGTLTKPGRPVDPALGPIRADQATAQHVDWWDRNGHEPMEHDRFRPGFLTGVSLFEERECVVFFFGGGVLFWLSYVPCFSVIGKRVQGWKPILSPMSPFVGSKEGGGILYLSFFPCNLFFFFDTKFHLSSSPPPLSTSPFPYFPSFRKLLPFRQFYDALNFLTSPHTVGSGSASELPLAGGQWRVRRRMEHVAQRGESKWTWIWEHGFQQGVREAKAVWELAG